MKKVFIEITEDGLKLTYAGKDVCYISRDADSHETVTTLFKAMGIEYEDVSDVAD